MDTQHTVDGQHNEMVAQFNAAQNASTTRLTDATDKRSYIEMLRAEVAQETESERKAQLANVRTAGN